MKYLEIILLIVGILLWTLYAYENAPIFAPILVNVSQLIYILWFTKKQK